MQTQLGVEGAYWIPLLGDRRCIVRGRRADGRHVTVLWESPTKFCVIEADEAVLRPLFDSGDYESTGDSVVGIDFGPAFHFAQGLERCLPRGSVERIQLHVISGSPRYSHAWKVAEVAADERQCYWYGYVTDLADLRPLHVVTLTVFESVVPEPALPDAIVDQLGRPAISAFLGPRGLALTSSDGSLSLQLRGKWEPLCSRLGMPSSTGFVHFSRSEWEEIVNETPTAITKGRSFDGTRLVFFCIRTWTRDVARGARSPRQDPLIWFLREA